jgi:hypothetical protein
MVPRRPENSRSLNTTMSSIQRGLRPICAPFLHPKHATRIQLPLAALSSPWSRSFHATASCSAVDLSYSLHDNQGDPIVILHGLFGSKKNNRSVSKYAVTSPLVPKLQADKVQPAPLPAPSPVPSMPSTSATTATRRTTAPITTRPLPRTCRPFSRPSRSRTRPSSDTRWAPKPS